MRQRQLIVCGVRQGRSQQQQLPPAFLPLPRSVYCDSSVSQTSLKLQGRQVLKLMSRTLTLMPDCNQTTPNYSTDDI